MNLSTRTATQTVKLKKDAAAASCDLDKLRAILDRHGIRLYDYIGLERFRDKVEIYTMVGTLECSADLMQSEKAEVNRRRSSGRFNND